MVMFRKAEKSLSKARICLAGPAGSGKTYSSLLIASGLGKRIAMIDTEHGSGDLYSDKFDYDILRLNPPFTCEKYLTGIKEAENSGYDIIIIDSLTHAWAGEGGLLDQQGKIADSGKFNSYTAWRMITPKHYQLVEAILQSKIHVIATARSKMEYAPESENGKIKRIQKVGMAPILRDGMEYEFSVVFDISTPEHIATSTKDRTSLFDGQFFKPTYETGKQILTWLNGNNKSTVINDQSLETSNKQPVTKTTKSGQNTVEMKENSMTTSTLLNSAKPGQGNSNSTGSNQKRKTNWKKFIKTITMFESTLEKDDYNAIIKDYLPIESLKENPDKQIELFNKLKAGVPF